MLNSLQGLRAFACLLVLSYHVCVIFSQPKYFGAKPFGSILDGGPIGLDLLFVLSGFVILHAHRSDLGRPDRLGGYLHRRLHRVFPTYWVALLAILPVFFLVPSFGDGSQRDLAVILRSIFLVPQPSGDAVLGVSWTMSLEVFFYLVFGLLVVHRGLGLVVFAAWAYLLWAQPWAGKYPLGFLHHPCFIPILGGMLAGEISHRIRSTRMAWGVAAGGLTLIAIAVLDALHWTIDYWTRVPLVAAAVMALMIGLVAMERAGRIRVPGFVLLFGDASYSIYLVHYPVLSVFCKIAKTARLDALVPMPALFVAAATSAVAAGLLFFQCVERPLRRWRKPTKPVDEAPLLQQERRMAA